MRALLLAVALGAAVIASAQDTATVGTKMSNAAVSKASSALRRGHKVTLTVDHKTVPYAAKNIRGMLYVPVRLFAETGQRVTWDGTDMRATIHTDNGPHKKSIEYDAKRKQSNFRPDPSMRPVYEKGRLWVPLASALAAYGHMAEWVPTSSRLNIRTNRG